MRSFFKVTLCGLISLILFLGSLLLYLSKSNVVEHEFTTYGKAEEAGAFVDAALPDFLPKSSRNIKSYRDLDANFSLVTFDFGADFQNFLDQQKSADIYEATKLAKRHGSSFSNLDNLMYFPLISSEPGLYHGSLLINLVEGKAVYVEPPEK